MKKGFDLMGKHRATPPQGEVTFQVANAEDILKINEYAHGRSSWRCIADRSVLHALDEEGTNMVGMHILNGDNPEENGVHVMWYLKLMGSEEPYTAWITMKLSDFNNLHTVTH